jgi:hypothetical protein
MNSGENGACGGSADLLKPALEAHVRMFSHELREGRLVAMVRVRPQEVVLVRRPIPPSPMCIIAGRGQERTSQPGKILGLAHQ